MADIAGKRIAILATHGFEQSELEKPLQQLRQKGAKVDVAAASCVRRAVTRLAPHGRRFDTNLTCFGAVTGPGL